MSTCLICGTSPYCVSLSCGCDSYCLECLQDWFLQQYQGLVTSETQTVTCPSADSRHELSLEEVLEIAKGGEHETDIEKTLLRVTLRMMPGTTFCPREGCDYVGWIDVDQRCRQPTECELCGEKWQEYALLPTWYQYLLFCKNTLAGQNEEFSIIWKDLWTKACPGCGALIEKNGGCPNMNCYRCNLSFCWTCMKPNRTHDSDYCSLRMMIWVLIYLVLAAIGVLKVASTAEILSVMAGWMAVTACGVVLIPAGPMLLAYALFNHYECNFPARFCLFLLYAAAYALFAAYTELGAKVWALEAALIVAVAHCILGFSYVKHSPY